MHWVHRWCSFCSICCVALFTSSSNGPSMGQRSLTSSSMPQEQALAKGSRSSGAWTTGSGLKSQTMQNAKQRSNVKHYVKRWENAKWAPCLYLLWSAPKDWKHFALAGLSCQSECCRSRRRDDYEPRHLVRFNSNHSNVEAQPSKRSGHLWPTVNLTDFSHFLPISSNHPNMSIHVNTYTVLYTDHHLWSSVKSANHWWRLGGRRWSVLRQDTIDVGVWSNMTFKELTCLRPWDVQRIHVCSWSIWFRKCSLQDPVRDV